MWNVLFTRVNQRWGGQEMAGTQRVSGGELQPKRRDKDDEDL